MSRKNTNQEILAKAIQKAIDGGWNGVIFGWEWRLGLRIYRTHSDFIFNHDFAKALWGEWSREELKAEYHNIYELEPWQYHLQQMVIAEDPIKYLGENIWTTKHYPL